MAVWLRLRSLQEDAPPASVVQTASATTDATALEDATTTSAPLVETYTITPAAPGGGEVAPETTQQRLTRQQRYEELLRNPPPSSAPPQTTPLVTTQEPTTPFQRIVTPIANALGINRPAQQQRPPVPPPSIADRPRMQPQSSNSNSSSGSNSSSSNDSRNNDNNDRNPNAEDDRETDIVPPQLLTADFFPQQVNDGEETTFAVNVRDNLSGVRSVSGVIASPSGSLQGFACSREGDSNRFVARINIPREAPAGTWSVKYLTLSDNASNSVNLNQTQGSLPGTARFQVSSSASDSTGPTLRGVSLERDRMRAGEKNTLFLQADDEKSGVSFASGVFISPGKAARIGFGCRAGAGGMWECPVSPGTCLDCGVWILEQVQLQDKANNMSTFRNDNAMVKAVTLDIAGDSCDSIAPTLTMLTLSPTVISNAQASVITVQATLQDEGGCGSATISAQAIPPGGIGGQRRPVTFTPSTDGSNFTGRLEMAQFAAKGEWSIAWVQVTDKGGNLRSYGASDQVLARATFRVE